MFNNYANNHIIFNFQTQNLCFAYMNGNIYICNWKLKRVKL